jgi:hypothetical protein
LLLQAGPIPIIKQRAPAAIGVPCFFVFTLLQLNGATNKATARQASFKTYSPQRLLSLPDLKAKDTRDGRVQLRHGGVG